MDAQVRTAKKCRCCDFEYTGGPDRIASHILKIASAGIQGCTLENGDPAIVAEFAAIREVLTARRAKATTARNDAEQSRAHDRSATEAAAVFGAVGAANSSNFIDLEQHSITRFVAAQGKGALPTPVQVNLAWTRAFVANGIPLHVVDNQHFIEAVLATATAGTSFISIAPTTHERRPRLANRQAFSGKLLDETDAGIMADVTLLKNPMTEDTGLSVMSDGMTNIQNRSLLNVLCSNPAGQYFVKVIDTSGKVKTKEYIAEEAIRMIEAEGAENVVVLVMDGACRSSFPLINAKYPHVICLICCAHGLDLTLEDFAKPNEQGPVVCGHERFAFDTSFVRDTLRDNRDIVKFVTNHQSMLAAYRRLAAKLTDAQKPRGGTELLKPGETRFATEFIATERVFKCRMLLEQLVVGADFPDWLARQSTTVKASALETKRLVLDSTHWDATRAIVEATEPLYSLLRFCDGECLLRW